MSRRASVGTRLAAFLAVPLLLTACGTAADTPPGAPADPATYESRLVAATNAVRTSRDLPILRVDRCVADAARERATDLLDADELEHARLNGLVETCDPGARAAENLVDSGASPTDVVEAWMASPGHRNNIIDPELRVVGIGCVPSDQGILCSQVFLGPG